MNTGGKWHKQHEQLLAKVWPQMGIACARMFPEHTKPAVRSKAHHMGLLAPKKAEAEPLVITRAHKRNSRSCFGYIPGGPAASIFDLGARV